MRRQLIALFALLVTGLSAAGAVEPGDANGDGQVDFADVSPLVMSMLAPQWCAGCCSRAADMHRDGVIDARDLDLLLEHASMDPAPAEFVPWVEFNGTDEGFRDVTRGLPAAATWAQRMIVTVDAGRVEGDLRRVMSVFPPGLKLIPAVKTCRAVMAASGLGEAQRAEWDGWLDDPSVWTAIAADVHLAAKLTKSTIVVLDSEGLLLPIWQGTGSVRTERFRRCVAQLPTDVTIWWYPTENGARRHQHEQYERYFSIARAVAATRPDTWFVTTSDQTVPVAPHIATINTWRADNRADFRGLHCRQAPVMYFIGRSGVETRDWLPSELPQIRLDYHGVILVYSGIKRWPDFAADAARALRGVR